MPGKLPSKVAEQIHSFLDRSWQPLTLSLAPAFMTAGQCGSAAWHCEALHRTPGRSFWVRLCHRQWCVVCCCLSSHISIRGNWSHSTCHTFAIWSLVTHRLLAGFQIVAHWSYWSQNCCACPLRQLHSFSFLASVWLSIETYELFYYWFLFLNWWAFYLLVLFFPFLLTACPLDPELPALNST